MRISQSKTSLFVNPGFVFSTIWSVLLIVVLSRGVVRLDLHNLIFIVILLNIGVAVVQLFFISNCADKCCYDGKNNHYLRSTFLNIRFFVCVFILGTFIGGIYCHGWPLIWLLMHNGKTYADYGIPSFSGAVQGVYSFLVLVLSYFVFNLKLKRYRKYLFLMMLFPMLVVSRGLLMVTSLQVLLVYLSSRRLSYKVLICSVSLILIATSLFGSLFIFRNGLSYSELRGAAVGKRFYEINNSSMFLPRSLILGYVMGADYVATPAENLLAAYGKVAPSYIPYWSTQSLFPDFVRTKIFHYDGYAAKFPIPLINPAYNATTSYGNFFADFGCTGAFLGIFLFQLIAMRWYRRRGLIKYYLLNILACSFLAFSFFYAYYITLPFILQMFLVVIQGRVVFVKSYSSHFSRKSLNYVYGKV